MAALFAAKGGGGSGKSLAADQADAKAKASLVRTHTGMSATSGKSLKAESVVEEQQEYQAMPVKPNPLAGLFSPKK